MKTPLVLVLLAVYLTKESTSSKVVGLLTVAREVLFELFQTWEMIAPKGLGDNIPAIPLVTREHRLISRMLEISRGVTLLDRDVKDANRRFMELVNNDLPSTVKTELRLSALLECVAGIEVMDHSFQEYLKTGIGNEEYGTSIQNGDTGTSLEAYTLQDFATTIVSHASYSVRSMSSKIHMLLLDNTNTSELLNRRGILEDMRNLTESNMNLCNIKQSPQQLLFNLYNALQLTQLKAYTMIQFSWMLLRLYNKGNFTSESKLLQKTYIDRMEKQANEINKVLTNAKRDIWECDPHRHIPEETFTEVTKLLQGYIVNEVDLNSEMTCREDCGYYKHTKVQGCYKENFCARQKPCRGSVIDCKFVDSDMWICPSDNFSKRRYDWIHYENGRTLGQKKSCSKGVTKVDSWWRWLFWHCSFCMCLCDDPKAPDTERYFNLRPVISNMTNNMVITGLRFQKINRVIHIQIQQGKMLPRGSVNESTVTWQPVDSYDITSSGVKDGIDYHTLTWQQRAMDLDDLVALDNQVLTGIRFRKLGTHLNLEIQISEFDFNTGKLKQAGNKSQWLSNDNTDGSLQKPRTKLVLENPDISTRTVAVSTMDSQSDQYFEFSNSDIDTDAAQTTIPFIDIQDVSSKPPVPLSGAGIYHKGQRYFGGFMGLKIFTLDFRPHIQSTFPEIQEMRRV